MFKTLKTKVWLASVLTVSLLFSAFSVFAANTLSVTCAQTSEGVSLSDSVDSATPINATDSISINATISKKGANITILVVDASLDIANEQINSSDILYINQTTLAPTINNYSITFPLPKTIGPGTYAVYIGGDEADTPVAKYFKIKTPFTPYVSGDIDKNGRVEIADAVYVLRYASSITPPANVVWDTIAGDVDGNSIIDNNDAKYILHYITAIPLPENIKVGQTITE